MSGAYLGRKAMKKNGTRVLSNDDPLPVYGFGHCRSVEEQLLHFLQMYVRRLTAREK